MTNAREDVFASIRRSLGVRGTEAPRRAAVADRLARAPRGPIPARGLAPDRLAVFRAEAERARASVSVAPTAADAPAEIARFLRDANLPPIVRMGDDELLAALPWSTTAIELSIGSSGGADLTAVSRAFAAVAETGALVLAGGSANPTTLNFLPDNHIIVIRASDLVPCMEEVWTRLRHRFGPGEMPRALNLVTGPSRSADIEQTMLLGAHGPRRVHAIIIEAC